MDAQKYEWALWLGNEVEGPHLGKKTLFVMGLVPTAEFLTALRARVPEAVYFGAGRRRDIPWVLVALAIGRVNVVTVESDLDSSIPSSIQELADEGEIELVLTLSEVPIALPHRIKIEDLEGNRLWLFNRSQHLTAVDFTDALVAGDSVIACKEREAE